ncbi:MAG: diphthine--ammonia ligase [Thermoplasmata archaeon]
MKAISLFSGGKDSYLSARIAMEQGFDIVELVTVVPEEFSMMYHYPNSAMSSYPGTLIGRPLVVLKETEIHEYLNKLRNRDIDAVVSGAVESEYQKTRIEKMCTDASVISYAPLWRKDQELLLKELLMRGIEAIIVSVSAEGLDQSYLGRPIDQEMLEKLLQVRKRYGINIIGEGGEYESFVISDKSADRKIEIRKHEVEWHESYGYFRIIDAVIV